ncbi:MAG: GNAT family N-acetyltransferase [Pseudomonadota bacterium]
MVVSTIDGVPVAIVPFYVENNLGRAVLGTTLQPFGRSNSFESMVDTPVAVCRAGFETSVPVAVRAHLIRQSRGWDVAALYSSPNVPPLVQRAQSQPGLPNVVEVTRLCDEPLTVPLPGSWAEYRASLSKSMRDNVAYYPRKLSRERRSWTIRVARSPLDIGAATDLLINLHRMRSASGRGIPHRNHIATEPQAEFLRSWFRRAAERDQVAIFMVEVEGEIIAAQAFLESAGCLAVYYSGYDDRFYRYSPLTIITAEAIRRGIERHATRIEFPPTLTPWKSRWGAQKRHPVVEISLYSTRTSALARGFLRRLCFRALAAQIAPVGPQPA